MCPKALGQAIMGGLRVPGAVSSENWRCGRDKEALNHQRAKGLQVKQMCKGKNEHGRVAGVLEAWNEAWLSEKAPGQEH